MSAAGSPNRTKAFESTRPTVIWIPVATLLLVSIFNFLDRTLMTILQIPIKTELGLSDTQLGALLGLAFGLVYTVLGLPLGRLADRTSRRWVLTGALAIWTIMTGLSGFARTFIGLMVCRMGVALGEAACAPTSHALISQLVPRERRASAIAVWAMGVPIGIILGFVIGGWLNAVLGWRRSFVAVGLAGCLLVPVVAIVLRGPARGHSEEPLPGLAAVMLMVARQRSYRMILIAAALHLYTLHSMSIWLPQFYARVFALPTREVGGIMALQLGVGAALGMALGGFLGDRLARRDARWHAWLSAGAALALVPLALVQLWAESLGLSVAAGIASGVCLQVFFSPMIALTQSLMPQRVRGLTGAIYVSVVNVFAMTTGPLVTGRISDAIVHDNGIGPDSLRYALTAALVGSALSVPFFLTLGRTLRADLAAAEE